MNEKVLQKQSDRALLVVAITRTTKYHYFKFEPINSKGPIVVTFV